MGTASPIASSSPTSPPSAEASASMCGAAHALTVHSSRGASEPPSSPASGVGSLLHEEVMKMRMSREMGRGARPLTEEPSAVEESTLWSS